MRKYEKRREQFQFVIKTIHANTFEMFKVENSFPEITLNILFEEMENFYNPKKRSDIAGSNDLLNCSC